MGGAYSGSVREDVGMLEIAPGLRRWTARHEDWEEDVGSLAVEMHSMIRSLVKKNRNVRTLPSLLLHHVRLLLHLSLRTSSVN